MIIERSPGSRSNKMLTAVMPIVDAATASGADTAQTYPHALAFNLFGQGVAFVHSARTLIDAQQPVEAPPALRGLTIIASRFEQIADDSGPKMGIGITSIPRNEDGD